MLLYIQIHRLIKCSCKSYIRDVNECNIYTTIDVVVKRRIVIVGIILVSKTTILPTMPSRECHEEYKYFDCFMIPGATKMLISRQIFVLVQNKVHIRIPR